MRILLQLALALSASAPALSADFVITKEKHTDRAKVMGQDQPAKDTKEVVWIGKDRLRVEEGDKVTIVRLDLKKMYMLDTKAKTSSSLDLPVEVSKMLPEEMRPMMEQMFSQITVSVTPTEETKKIKDWDTTKYKMTMSLPMGGSMEQEMWVAKGIGGKREGWHDLYAAVMSANPVRAGMVDEMKKIDGVPVLVERTQKMMGSEIKSRETVISVEEKEAAEGFYDLPKDYKNKPFDPMAEIQMGPGGPPKR
ncbi:MAG: hypothetical protein ACKVXR_11825 [Planctomycetota bacterium]